jgi:hypothetical protein
VNALMRFDYRGGVTARFYINKGIAFAVPCETTYIHGQQIVHDRALGIMLALAHGSTGSRRA